MTYEQLTVFVVVLGAILGFVFMIDKFVDLIKKYKKPADNVQEKLRQHKEQIDSDNERITALEQYVKDANRVQNKVLIQMCSHMAYGNHTEKLIEAKEELENYLINH